MNPWYVPVGLYYEHAGNRLLQDMCFLEAEKLNSGEESKTYLRMVSGSSKQAASIITSSKAASSKPATASSTFRQASSAASSQVMGVVKEAEEVGGTGKTDELLPSKEHTKVLLLTHNGMYTISDLE